MNCSNLKQGQSTQGLHRTIGAAPFGAFLLLVLFSGCGQHVSTATAWLRVGDPQTIGGNPQQRNAAEYELFRNTQAALIKSPLVLREALEMPGIGELSLIREQHDPQKWLAEHLNVVCPKDQELIKIEFPGKDIQQAATIVNAVKSAYLENIVLADYYNRLKQRELVENSYREIMAQMQKKRELLDKLLGNLNSNKVESVADFRDRAVNFERARMDIRARRIDVDLQAASAETRMAKVPADSADAAKARLDLAVAEAQRKVLDHAEDEISRQLKDLEELRSDGSEYMSLREEIKQLEQNAGVRSRELERLKLELSLPQRVVSLQDATSH